MDISDLKDLYLAETQERCERIVADVLAIEGGDGGRIAAVQGEIHSLKGACGFAGLDDVSHLCHQMESYLTRMDRCGVSDLPEGMQPILDGCDFVCRHAGGVARGEPLPCVPDALAGRLGPGASQSGSGPTLSGRVVYEADGIVATAAPDAMRIRLRRATCRDHRDAVIAGLHHIYEQTPDDRGWIVDLSYLGKISISVVGALVAHQEDLRRRDREIKLVGVGPRLLPPMYMERLTEWFCVQCRVPVAGGEGIQ